MENLVENYIGKLAAYAIEMVPKIVLAILILFVGLKIIKRLQVVLQKWIEKSISDPEISGFLVSIIDIILRITVILVAASAVGIEFTAIFGILAAAGFAVGMALQGFLGNFASGITIVFFKPYKVGDWVQVAESFGQVKSIQIFNTILQTPGDKTLVIPNGKVTDSIITNYSSVGKIRLELSILMGYEESYPKVEKVIRDALSSLDIIVHDPKPQVGIESYDTHNIIVTVRPYIHPDHYWDATFQVNQAIKKAMSENGIRMAYSEGVELGPIGG